jgi:hypothetical protein
VTEDLLVQLLADTPAVLVALLYVRHLHRDALRLLTEIRDELRVTRALKMSEDRLGSTLTGARR